MNSELHFSSFQPALVKDASNSLPMEVQVSVPANYLAGVIYRFVKIRVHQPMLYDVKADGCQALYMGPASAFWLGARDHAIQIPIAEKGDYFGLWLHPGLGQYLPKQDCSQWFNRSVHADESPFPDYAELVEQLYSVDQFDLQSQIAFDWCARQILYSDNIRGRQIVNAILKAAGSIRVNALAEQVGITTRQLNRLFQRDFGLSTKTFIDVQRAQAALKSLYLEQISSAERAHACGFFDQSHYHHTMKRYLKSEVLTF